jgi:hypothetical protein
VDDQLAWLAVPDRGRQLTGRRVVDGERGIVKHRRLAWVVVALLAAACGGLPTPLPSSTPLQSRDAESPTATVATAEPSADPAAFDVASITQVCEAWRGRLPRIAVTCDWGVRTALRSLGHDASSVSRVVFRYSPPCDPGEACRRDPSRAWAWISSSSAGELLVELQVTADGGLEALPPTAGKRLALANPFQPPSIERPEIPGSAPREVRDREPLPLCGVETASVEDPLDRPARRCFLNSVLAGQGAELITQGRGTEGEAVINIDRFTGGGAVVTYRRDQGVWMWTACGITPVETESVFEIAGLCANRELATGP